MPQWLETLLELMRSEHIELVLFLSAFISATILPGGSEAVLAGATAAAPDRVVELIAVATLGNALGGMTGWCIGRYIPQRKVESRAVEAFRKWGIWALLFTWVPLVGDALPIAAGWLRLNPWVSFVLIALGKGLRYTVVAGAMLPFFS